MVQSDGQPYLVRFGVDATDATQMRMEYVLKAPGWSYSGTPDKQGNFHILDQASGTKKLYTFTDVHQLVGYTHTSAPGLVDHTDQSAEFQYTSSAVADIVPLHADLEGAGKRDYLVGARTNKVLVIRMKAAGYNYEKWELTATSTEGIDLALNGAYGAAWNYPDTDGDDHIYITANSGAGVFEVVDMVLGGSADLSISDVGLIISR
eukprot:TRINITY_DN331_c0_g1_i21.p1 TRINITY_DN331_c0_g1~~TRINITY_DN331_c0_g1_i21.p1  ORF type:complete len:206 (-),score=30.00 TRINITY_DN331_c0_g1_i21:293-910(-)